MSNFGIKVIRPKNFSRVFSNVDLFWYGPLDFSNVEVIKAYLLHILRSFLPLTQNPRVISYIKALLKASERGQIGENVFVENFLALSEYYEIETILSTQSQVIFYMLATFLVPGLIREKIFCLMSKCVGYSDNCSIFLKKNFIGGLKKLDERTDFSMKFCFNVNDVFFDMEAFINGDKMFPSMNYMQGMLFPATSLEIEVFEDFNLKLRSFICQLESKLPGEILDVIEVLKNVDQSLFLFNLFKFTIEQWSRIRIVHSCATFEDQISILITHIEFRKLFCDRSDLNFQICDRSNLNFQILLDNSLTDNIPRLMFMFESLAKQPDKLDDLRLFIFSTSVFPACLEFIASTFELHWIINECLHIDVGLYNTGLSRLCEVLNHFYLNRGPQGFLECFRNRSSIIIRFLRMGCSVNFILTIMNGNEYFDNNFNTERDIEIFLPKFLEHIVKERTEFMGLQMNDFRYTIKFYAENMYFNFLERYLIVMRDIDARLLLGSRNISSEIMTEFVVTHFLKHFSLKIIGSSFICDVLKDLETNFNLNSDKTRLVSLLIQELDIFDILEDFNRFVRFISGKKIVSSKPKLRFSLLEVSLDFVQEDFVHISRREYLSIIYDGYFHRVLSLLKLLNFDRFFILDVAKIFHLVEIGKLTVESTLKMFLNLSNMRGMESYLPKVIEKIEFGSIRRIANFFAFALFMDLKTLQISVECTGFYNFLNKIVNDCLAIDQMANISLFIVNMLHKMRPSNVFELLNNEENFLLSVVEQFCPLYSEFLCELVHEVVCENEGFNFRRLYSRDEFYTINCLLALDTTKFPYVRMALKDRRVGFWAVGETGPCHFKVYIDLTEMVFGGSPCKCDKLKSSFLVMLILLEIEKENELHFREILIFAVKFMILSGPNDEYSEILEIIKNNEELRVRGIYFEESKIQKYLEEYQNQSGIFCYLRCRENESKNERDKAFLKLTFDTKHSDSTFDKQEQKSTQSLDSDDVSLFSPINF